MMVVPNSRGSGGFIPLIVSCFLFSRGNAFYLPGVNPQSFAEGDEIRLKVNKLTSSQTLMPIDYYKLPFCQPEGGPMLMAENLGEYLSGDRIESSPYLLHMKEEVYCQFVCLVNVGRAQQNGVAPNKLTRAIRKNYHHNWIVDNLPAASKAEDEYTITTRYWQGFPIGYIGSDSIAYVNNHVDIEIMYHPVDSTTDYYRIVRFTVEPFSIKHEFEPAENCNDDSDYGCRENAEITNPIASCDRKRKGGARIHTNWDMTVGKSHEPQPASGKVLFTYDVIWIENTDLHWANRWDMYLTMDEAVPAKVHWLPISNSIAIAAALSGMILAFLVRSLRSRSRYNRLATDEVNPEEFEEFGWKLVGTDVFRPPKFSPLLLSVACGTGAQILVVSFLTILFALMGFLNPSNRGSLLMGQLLFYVLSGGVGGYVTARFYKTFHGKNWQRASTLTILGYPGISFAFFSVMDLISVSQGSTNQVPFLTLLVLLMLWFGICAPLVLFGAYYGYKQNPIEFPINNINTTGGHPRPIPDQPWFMSIALTLPIAGILPFCVCFTELYFILADVWMGQYYYVYGFLLTVFILLLVTCAEITVLFHCFQLCSENHHWWWRSFCTGGSVAVCVLVYSLVFFTELDAVTSLSFLTFILYFGYMLLVSLALFLMTGFIGVLSALWLNKKLYASIKHE